MQFTHLTQINDINIEQITPLITPAELKDLYPLTNQAFATVLDGRKTIQAILDGKDKRILVVIGPCSIHDTIAAHEYADRLKQLAQELKNELFIVMRVYFEKPRTTAGKG